MSIIKTPPVSALINAGVITSSFPWEDIKNMSQEEFKIYFENQWKTLKCGRGETVREKHKMGLICLNCWITRTDIKNFYELKETHLTFAGEGKACRECRKNLLATNSTEDCNDCAEVKSALKIIAEQIFET
nr:uncharacterized protein LOC124212455 [Neodiprion pinetum]